VQLEAILETVLYYSERDREDMEAFYRDILGLRRVSGWPDGMAFRVGAGVLLLFDAGKTAARPDEDQRHGASGPVHACFLARPGEYESWKAVVPVLEELTWKNGARSFYFRDPAGNLLEIAERDLWPA
jgi:catechol 2,3-dioxygenase-like lactoylglutathione lyase family enzyme